MKILIAPDKFKGSMRASDVAAHVAAGISSVSPAVEVVTVPVADGGDGTLDAAAAAGFTLVPVTVDGPTGEPVDTGYAEKDGTAVVELADACGLVRLPGAHLVRRVLEQHIDEGHGGGLIEGVVLVAALGRLHAGRAAGLAFAGLDGVAGGGKPDPGLLVAALGEACPAGVAVVHKDGRHPGVGVNGRGHPADVPAVTGGHEGQEPDGRVLRGR